MIMILLIWVGFVKLVKINQLGRIYWHMKIGHLFIVAFIICVRLTINQFDFDSEE
jgi:hypothetical protein